MILRMKLVIVIIVLFGGNVVAQQPSVPCPNVFQYARADNKNIGLITINKVNYGETVVEIELSQSGSINPEFAGDLKLNFNKDDIFDYIKLDKAVTYRVDFSLDNVIPQVSSIRVNGAQICSGPKVSAPSTTVTLKHTLTAPGSSSSSNTPQETTPPKWINSPTRSLPWAASPGVNNPRTNFGYPNFLSSTYNTQPKQTFSKDNSNLFHSVNLPRTTVTLKPPSPVAFRTDFRFPNFLSPTHTHTQQKESFFKDPTNPFINGNNDFHYVLTTPSPTTTTTTTTTTTKKPGFDTRNPTAFLDAINRSRLTTPAPTTTSTTTTTTPATTTTTTTTTPRPRPSFNFIPGPPSQIIPEPRTPTQFMRKSNGWSYMDSVCGQENFDFTVKKLAVNGADVPRARFPWIVALFKKNVGSLTFQCGGSLITTRTVISAAHCFYAGFNLLRDDEILVSMGRHNLTDWTDTYIVHSDVAKIIRHPDYRPELVNIDADLAIIQLKQSVTFSFAIRPVCLWSGRFDVSVIEGVSGTVVGWGKDENNNDITTAPRLITAIVVSEITCIRSNQQLLYLTSNRTLCAGNRDGTGPCNGDSGSGLMIRNRNKWMLRGTVSASLTNEIDACNLDEYVVYTDIAQFIGWIYANSVF